MGQSFFLCSAKPLAKTGGLFYNKIGDLSADCRLRVIGGA